MSFPIRALVRFASGESGEVPVEFIKGLNHPYSFSKTEVYECFWSPESSDTPASLMESQGVVHNINTLMDEATTKQEKAAFSNKPGYYNCFIYVIKETGEEFREFIGSAAGKAALEQIWADHEGSGKQKEVNRSRGKKTMTAAVIASGSALSMKRIIDEESTASNKRTRGSGRPPIVESDQESGDEFVDQEMMPASDFKELKVEYGKLQVEHKKVKKELRVLQEQQEKMEANWRRKYCSLKSEFDELKKQKLISDQMLIKTQAALLDQCNSKFKMDHFNATGQAPPESTYDRFNSLLSTPASSSIFNSSSSISSQVASSVGSMTPRSNDSSPPFSEVGSPVGSSSAGDSRVNFAEREDVSEANEELFIPPTPQVPSILAVPRRLVADDGIDGDVVSPPEAFKKVSFVDRVKLNEKVGTDRQKDAIFVKNILLLVFSEEQVIAGQVLKENEQRKENVIYLDEGGLRHIKEILEWRCKENNPQVSRQEIQSRCKCIGAYIWQKRGTIVRKVKGKSNKETENVEVMQNNETVNTDAVPAVPTIEVENVDDRDSSDSS